MKKSNRFSVLKEPIPLFLLLTNILFLLIILYLCQQELCPPSACFPLLPATDTLSPELTVFPEEIFSL